MLLLDVDGVLNPIRPDVSKLDWVFEPPFKSSKASGGWTLNLSKELGSAIEDLNCSMVWLTTWILEGDFANTDIGPPLGWGRKAIPKIADPNDPYWKVEVARDILSAPGGKVIWADDDLGEWLSFFSSKSKLDPFDRLLPIVPNPSVGLTKAHLQQMKDFLGQKEPI